MVALDLDQAQPTAGILGQQSANQRRFSSTTGAPEQDVIGGQAIDELLGIGSQQITLSVDADQVVQTQIEIDLERRQIAASGVTLPARRQRMLPIDNGRLRGQQRLDTRQQAFGTLQEGFQLDIHD